MSRSFAPIGIAFLLAILLVACAGPSALTVDSSGRMPHGAVFAR